MIQLNNQTGDVFSENPSEPLILGGRPHVAHNGRIYQKDEAPSIESITCDFDPGTSAPWYNLEGIEQLVNLKRIYLEGEDCLDGVDLTPILSLSGFVLEI